METRSIKNEDYDLILQLDKLVYPTESPVTKEIISSWYQNNPEFGIIFEDEKIKGMCVAIPLNKEGWKNLIQGKLLESQLSSKTIFNNSRDKEIGIHIYHLEKFDKTIKNFHVDALKEINKVINKLKKTNPALKIIGFSGLAVTSQGISLCYDKWNCRERNFLNKEHIIEKKGKLKVVELDSYEELKKYLDEGYNYKNRCKMFILYPGEPSVVWKYLG